MALWQFRLELLPQRWLDAGGAVESLFTDDGACDPAAAWAAYAAPGIEERLAAILPAGRSWHSALACWGTEQGDDIELWRENGTIGSLTVHFDLRRPNMTLVTAVIGIADAFNLALLVPGSRRVLERSTDALLRAAGESDAAHFVIDPHSFLAQCATANTLAT